MSLVLNTRQKGEKRDCIVLFSSFNPFKTYSTLKSAVMLHLEMSEIRGL